MMISHKPSTQGSQFDDSPIISPSSIDCSGPPVASIPQESVDSQLLLDDLPTDSSFSIDLEASIDRFPDWDRVENPVHLYTSTTTEDYRR